MSAPLTFGFLAGLLGGPYYGHIFAGARQMAQELGVQLLGVQFVPEEIQRTHLALEKVDGWIAVLTHREHEAAVQLAQMGVRIVTVNGRLPYQHCPAVFSDIRHGMYSGVEHLIRHGHTRIAFVGNMLNDTAQLQHAGYEEALLHHGIRPDPRLTIDVNEHGWWGHGEQVATRLVQEGMPCTAIVTCQDYLSLGIMSYLQRHGYRVPEDIAVVGFDDGSVAELAKPTLTTIRQNSQEVGRLAVQVLWDHCHHRLPETNTFFAPTALLTRRSCGCQSIQDLLSMMIQRSGQEETWQKELAQQLLQLALYPLHTETTYTATEKCQAAIQNLVQGLEQVLAHQSEGVPDVYTLKQAWHTLSAWIVPYSLDIAEAMVLLLEHAGRQQAQSEGSNALLHTYMSTVRSALLRSYAEREMRQKDYMIGSNGFNHQTSVHLFTADPGEAQRLQWLKDTPAHWGVLALWDRQQADEYKELIIAGVFHRTDVHMMGLEIGQRFSSAEFPPLTGMPFSTEAVNVTALLHIHTVRHDFGILFWCGPVPPEDILLDRSDVMNAPITIA